VGYKWATKGLRPRLGDVISPVIHINCISTHLLTCLKSLVSLFPHHALQDYHRTHRLCPKSCFRSDHSLSLLFVLTLCMFLIYPGPLTSAQLEIRSFYCFPEFLRTSLKHTDFDVGFNVKRECPRALVIGAIV